MWIRLKILADARTPLTVVSAGDGTSDLHSRPAADETRSLVPTDGQIRLGRHPNNDWILPYVGISATHARVFQKNGSPEWWLEDLGSSNGTWLGEHRLTAGTPETVKVGDTFRLGALAVQFEAIHRDRAHLEGGESTATIGRRMLTDAMLPPAGDDRSGEASSVVGRPEVVRPGPTRSPRNAEVSRRASVAPGRDRVPARDALPKNVLIVFALGMTAVAVVGIIALVLTLR